MSNQGDWKESVPAIPETCKVPLSGPVNLQGRVAIVTGAESGIGQAACYAMARAGAKIAVSDIRTCAETGKELKSFGADFIEVKTDVTKEEDCNNLANTALEKFGRIDILLNSAGVLELTPIDKLSLEEWNRVINVDLTGTFLCTKAVWSVMKKQQKGKIICLSSAAAKIGGAMSGPHYVAAKAGVSGFIKWCAKYGAPDGILVNGVAPGLVFTPMTMGGSYPPENMASTVIPAGRFARVEDIAEPIIFLASDMSNYMTGCMLDLNGGMWMSL